MITSILTGDIIGSRKALHPEEWILPLKAVLSTFGEMPVSWEIYRGDSFQLEVSRPEEALQAALLLKATLKQQKNRDVRIGIGVGEKRYSSDRVTESNGPAFERSGDCFEHLKQQKRSLAIATGSPETDEELNTLLHLGLALIDRWRPSAAQLVATALQHPDLSQQGIASLLDIRQSTVSSGLKRAHFSLIQELDLLYRKKISAIFNT
jgi:hypothetical protein